MEGDLSLGLDPRRAAAANKGGWPDSPPFCPQGPQKTWGRCLGVTRRRTPMQPRRKRSARRPCGRRKRSARPSTPRWRRSVRPCVRASETRWAQGVRTAGLRTGHPHPTHLDWASSCPLLCLVPRNRPLDGPSEALGGGPMGGGRTGVQVCCTGRPALGLTRGDTKSLLLSAVGLGPILMSGVSQALWTRWWFLPEKASCPAPPGVSPRTPLRSPLRRDPTQSG